MPIWDQIETLTQIHQALTAGLVEQALATTAKALAEAQAIADEIDAFTTEQEEDAAYARAAQAEGWQELPF